MYTGAESSYHTKPMVSIYFFRQNPDGTTDLFLEWQTEDIEQAEDFCDMRNSTLAAAGIPSSVAHFYVV